MSPVLERSSCSYKNYHHLAVCKETKDIVAQRTNLYYSYSFQRTTKIRQEQTTKFEDLQKASCGKLSSFFDKTRNSSCFLGMLPVTQPTPGARKGWAFSYLLFLDSLAPIKVNSYDSLLALASPGRPSPFKQNPEFSSPVRVSDFHARRKKRNSFRQSHRFSGKNG